MDPGLWLVTLGLSTSQACERTDAARTDNALDPHCGFDTESLYHPPDPHTERDQAPDMTQADFRLEAAFAPLDDPVNGRMTLTLINISDRPLKDICIALSMMTRVAKEHQCVGPTMLRRVANFHEFQPTIDAMIAPGGLWTLTPNSATP